MINLVRGLIYFVVLVVIQVVLLNNIYFLRVATPFLYLYFIIKMPIGVFRESIILSSFFIGLVIDMFTNTPGMHAAACTLVGFVREPLIHLFMGKDLLEGSYPSYYTFGVGGFIRYVSSIVVLHHVILFVIESLTLFDPMFLVMRIVASVIATVLLVCTIEVFNIDPKKSGS